MSRVLRRKLRRDLWRQHWQFVAVALILAIGVAAYVAATDAYRNLGESFDRAYTTQRLPDAVLSGPAAGDLVDAARRLPGSPVVDLRRQGDVGLRIQGHTLLGRAVEVPAGRQPEVSRLALRSGALPRPGDVVVEQHLADHYGLRPGDHVQLLSPTGWTTFGVSGSALSTEYFWPARSMQEVMTTPEHFGVVFATPADVGGVVDDPTDQLLLYAEQRSQAPALTAAAARLARDGGLAFTAREDLPSYHTLQEDVDAVGSFSALLPAVFLVAAVLGTYVLLSRLVSAQRATIGTLAANGMSARTLRRHYLGYGLVAGLVGAVPGLVGGFFLGGWFTTSYTDALGLPLRVTSLHPRTLLIGVAVGVLAASLAAWVPARAAARTSPAEAMRVSPPGVHGGRSVAERLVPALRRMPARWRMTLRGIARNRRRTVLTVVGVGASVSLVMVFAGLRDTVSTVIDRQYGAIQLEDGQVLAAPGAGAAVLEAVRSDPGVAAAEPFARYDVTLSGPAGKYQTLLLALPHDTRMHRFGSIRQLPPSGVLLGEGTRARLGIGVGDDVTIALTQTGQRLQTSVAGFVDEPMSPVVYAAAESLSAVLGDDGLSTAAQAGVLLQLTPGGDEEAVIQRIDRMPGVVAYSSTATVAAAMREAFGLYDTLVGLMLVFAGVMAAALLYNAMSANVAERSVELGTLQAAGLGPGVLGRLVATENLLLVVVGLPLGLVGGWLLGTWYMARYATQGYQWHLDMRAGTPVVIAAGVLLAALLAQLPALRAIRRLDVARVVRERSL